MDRIIYRFIELKYFGIYRFICYLGATTMNKEIYQDSVKIIGKIEKLDCLRFGNTGLASFYFVLSIPNIKAKRNIFLPCTIYGNKAEEIEKLVSNHKIKLGDLLDVTGSHMNKNKGDHTSLEIKVSQFEEIGKENSLFGGK